MPLAAPRTHAAVLYSLKYPALQPNRSTPLKINKQLKVCLIGLAWLYAGMALGLPQPAWPRESPTDSAPAHNPERSSVTSTACGASWNTISSRVIGSGLTILNDIAALAPDNIWAGGSQITNGSRYPQPLGTHWDGTVLD